MLLQCPASAGCNAGEAGHNPGEMQSGNIREEDMLGNQIESINKSIVELDDQFSALLWHSVRDACEVRSEKEIALNSLREAIITYMVKWGLH